MSGILAPLPSNEQPEGANKNDEDQDRGNRVSCPERHSRRAHDKGYDAAQRLEQPNADAFHAMPPTAPGSTVRSMALVSSP